MHSNHVFLALEIARERAAEADAQRIARLAGVGVAAKRQISQPR